MPRPSLAEVRGALRAQQANKKARGAAFAGDAAAVQQSFEKALKELVQAFASLR